MRVARAPKIDLGGAKLHLKCGLEGQVSPKRRQVALGVRLGALKCGPRGAKLRLECGLEGGLKSLGGPKRRQVALGVRLGVLKCGPRDAK